MPVDNLIEGMYVSELDRPWTDTPFMLQGFHFEVSTHGQILRDHCAYVYVNIERSDDPGASVLTRCFTPKPRKPLTRWERVQRHLHRMLHHARTIPPRSVRSEHIVTSVSGSSGSRPLLRKPASPSLLARILEFLTPGDPRGDERRALDAGAIVVQREGQVTLHERVQAAHRSLTRSQATFGQVIDDIRRERQVQMSMVKEVVDGLVGIASEHPHAMIWLNKLKSREASSYEHAIEVSIYMVCLGQHLGYQREQLRVLGLAGLLQDIGYIKLPQGLLSVPGTLTREQYALVQSHIDSSLSMLRDTPGFPSQVLDIIAQHHERYDGSGYPRRLAKGAIDPMAQIAGLADTFHAMTSARPYREALSTNETLQKLYKWKGGCFNEGLVEQFIQCIGIYSVGTVVELNSGEIGIVIAQNRIRRLKPRVMVVLDATHRPCPSPRILDLINDHVDESGTPYSIRRDLPPDAHGIKADEYFL